MELIKINDTKLKVTLSALDMQCYELDCDRLDYDCLSTKTAFDKILSYAREKTGFDTGDDKIFVQIYPALSGGCEMYVTRLCDGGQSSRSVSAVYLFRDINTLCEVCAKLTECAFKEQSELYCAGEKYYLAISEDYRQNNDTYSVNERGKSLPRYPLLSEYGIRMHSERALCYVREHCQKLIGKGAVETLAKLK